MSIEFNHSSVMNHFKTKQKMFLSMTGHQGIVIAAEQIGKDGRQHWDTGASSNAKNFEFKSDDSIHISAPLDYDIYLERRFGIMAKATDMLVPYMARFEEEVFGK